MGQVYEIINSNFKKEDVSIVENFECLNLYFNFIKSVIESLTKLAYGEFAEIFKT